MSNELISIKVEPILPGTQKVFLECKARGISLTYVHRDEDDALVVSVLSKLGIPGRIVLTGDNSAIVVSGDGEVIMHPEWIPGEEVPVITVYRSGERIGAFSLDPMGVPDEIFCLGVLTVLGFEVDFNCILFGATG